MSEINNERLVSIIERIENVNQEIADLTEDRKGIMLEAKQAGFDTKAITKIVKLRAMDKQKREEEEQILDVYKRAVGLD